MKVEYYKDSAGKYRWRLVARNGLIVADSGQGYSRMRDAKRAFRRTIWKGFASPHAM